MGAYICMFNVQIKFKSSIVGLIWITAYMFNYDFKFPFQVSDKLIKS